MHQDESVTSGKWADWRNHLNGLRWHICFEACGIIGLLLAFSSNFLYLHDVEMWLSAKLNFNQVQTFSEKIVLIDVPLSLSEDGSQDPELKGFRAKLGTLLGLLASQANNKPELVALDINFDSGVSDYSEVKRGIETLKNNNIPVYGAINVFRDNTTELTSDIAKQNLKGLYQCMSNVGHNVIDLPKVSGAGPFYQPYLKMPSGLELTAMAVLISEFKGKRHGLSMMEEDRDALRYYIHLGPPLETNRPEQLLGYDTSCGEPYSFRRYKGECLRRAPQLNDKIVIVGRLSDDRAFHALKDRSGPELVAWALNDLISTKDAKNPRIVFYSTMLTWCLIIFLPVLALILFAKQEWQRKPKRAAAVAGGGSFSVLVVLILMARSFFGIDFGQILLPLFCTLLTLALATHYSGGWVKKQHISSIAELLAKGEGDYIEYKSTLRWDVGNETLNIKPLELAVIKTIAAFLNTHGGQLVIGAGDTGEPLGIDLTKENFKTEDKMLQHLSNLIETKIGLQHSPYIRSRFDIHDDKRLLVVDCDMAKEPVYVEEKDLHYFYIRVGATTRAVHGPARDSIFKKWF